jgi:hypothetical protein
LAATVLAVGLVFVSRGLGGQLKALRAVESYDTLSALADSKLLELEHTRLAAPTALETRPEGAFDAPYASYTWRLQAIPQTTPEGDAPTSLIRLTVQGPAGAWSLSSLWPTEEVPSAWF